MGVKNQNFKICQNTLDHEELTNNYRKLFVLGRRFTNLFICCCDTASHVAKNHIHNKRCSLFFSYWIERKKKPISDKRPMTQTVQTEQMNRLIARVAELEEKEKTKYRRETNRQGKNQRPHRTCRSNWKTMRSTEKHEKPIVVRNCSTTRIMHSPCT